MCRLCSGCSRPAVNNKPAWLRRLAFEVKRLTTVDRWSMYRKILGFKEDALLEVAEGGGNSKVFHTPRLLREEGGK